jgi:hypothetical protein
MFRFMPPSARRQKRKKANDHNVFWNGAHGVARLTNHRQDFAAGIATALMEML